MPDLETTGQVPTDETPPPEAGDNAAQPEAGQAPETDALNAEQLLAELKKTRREAAKYRTSLRKIETAEAERQRAEMSELERMKADLAQARQEQAQATERAQGQAIRAAVVAAAAKHNFADPADAVNFVEADTLTVQDDGTVEGVDEAIEQLAAAKPYLLKTGPAVQPGATNPARNSLGLSDDELRAQMYGSGQNAAVWDGGVTVFDNRS